MKEISNPHDKLFRETWSDKEAALDFLKHYLPQDVLQLIELDTLEISKDSFIEKELKDYYSDLLYNVQFTDMPGELAEGYVYFLFEHKSYPERFIHLQVLEYMLKIWRLHLKQKKTCQKKRRLPIIIPMVLYHGQEGWTTKTAFSELFFGPKDALARYIPDFEYILRDLTGYSDAEIKGTVLSQIVLLLFKHIFDPDIAQRLPEIFLFLGDILKQENGLRCIEMILRYIFSATEDITIDQLKTVVEQALSAGKGEIVMTLAEQLEKKGFERGMQQGMQQGIEKGIREGLLEGIELSLGVKFGDEGIKVMPFLYLIEDLTRLKMIKDAIKRAQDIEELKAIIEKT